jgi:hypothetical protein
MTTRSRSSGRKSGSGKVKKLNKAAGKIVDEHAGQIAQSLLDSTIKGHVLSAKLLVELAEGDVDIEEAATVRPLRSLLTELAEEPQWTDDSTGAEGKKESRTS